MRGRNHFIINSRAFFIKFFSLIIISTLLISFISAASFIQIDSKTIDAKVNDIDITYHDIESKNNIEPDTSVTSDDDKVDVDSECQQHGYDWGIAKYQCGMTTPEETGSGWSQGYMLTVLWNECISANWTSNLYVCGVLSKEATNTYNNSGGYNGTVSKHGQHDISHITFCGCDDVPSFNIDIEKSVWDENNMNWSDNVNSVINENLSFKLNITNQGNQTLTNINVEDTLPNFLLYNYDATGSPVVEQDHYIEWNVSMLAPQEFITFYYSTQCISNGTGANFVLVDSDQNASSEDYVNVTVEDEPNYDMIIEKMVWNETSDIWEETIAGYIGTNITFQINITNSGDTMLTNIVVQDVLPGFLLYNYDATGSPVVEQDHFIEWIISTLSPQQRISYTYSSYLAIQGAGYNIVNGTADEGVWDEDSVLIYSNQVPNPDILIAKYVLNESSGQLEEEIQGYIGDNLTFHITIYNMGNVDLSNIVVQDVLPGFLVYNYDATGSPVEEQDHFIKWQISSLSAGAYQTYTYTAQLTGIGDDNNIVTATTDEGVSSEDIVNITSEEVPVYSITIDKQVFNTTSGQYQDNIQDYIGSNLTFRISITNNGNEDLTNVILQDTLPNFLLYNYDATGSPVVEQDHFIEWQIVLLNVGETINITYSALITDIGDDDNYVIANTDQGASSDDIVHVTSQVLPVYDMQVEKKVWNNKSDQWVKKIAVLTDSIVSFRIIVSNNGTDTVTNVIVTDTLSNELVYLPGSATITPTSYTDHLITWSIGSLNPGSSVTIEFDAQAVGLGLDASNYVNCSSNEAPNKEDIVYIEIYTFDEGGGGNGNKGDCQTPIIQMISPDDGGTLYDMVNIQWYAINSDYQLRNEDIPIFLYLSGNNGRTWSRIGTVHTNNIDIEHGSFEWDTRTVSDGKYIIMGETWNTCGYIAYDKTKSFYVDNQNRGIQVSFTEIKDLTINSNDVIKSKDTVKITATITGTLASTLSCDNITADLRFFGDTIRKADTFDAFEANWIVENVSLKNKEGPITVTILIDGKIKGSCVIHADDIKPDLSIVKPNGGVYMLNQKIFPLPFSKSIVIGQLAINLDVADNYGIKKTEYYINDIHLETVKQEPFTYVLDLKSIGQTVQFDVIAYDYADNKITDSRQLVLYNLFGELW